eukprot:182847-Alexandrium_andersonii.AAC.1
MRAVATSQSLNRVSASSRSNTLWDREMSRNKALKDSGSIPLNMLGATGATRKLGAEIAVAKTALAKRERGLS